MITRGADISVLESAASARSISVSDRLGLLQAFFDSSAVSLCVTDVDHRFVLLNDRCCELFGYARQELIGERLSRVLPVEERDWAGSLRKAAGSAQERAEDWRVLDKSGFLRNVKVTRREVTLKGNRCLTLNILQETGPDQIRESGLQALAELIEQWSFKDPVTGLPNRAFMEEELEARMRRSAQSRRYHALLLIDLENFKIIRDTMGLKVSDDLLARVGTTIRRSIKRDNIVARLRADEFLVLLADLPTESPAAVKIVESEAAAILDQLSGLFNHARVMRVPSANIGAALFLGQTQTVDELMRKCSIAVYKAKAIGRNRFAFFDKALQASILERHRTEKELKLALFQDQLVPYFQAQVDGDGNVCGAELLMRWQHPERGLLPPSTFIEVAEGSELIIDIGYLAMEMAIRQLAEWATCEYASQWTLSVNISAKYFHEEDFEHRVAALLANHEFRPDRLRLEVTESSALLHDVERVSAVMNHLALHGVRFSLDDFGTGYSSLSYLKHLPIAELKIDGAFVRDLLSDENNSMITSAIISLAAALDLSVVAEGVETEAQLKCLREMGCSVFQGFFFDQPAPIDQFMARYRRNQAQSAI